MVIHKCTSDDACVRWIGRITSKLCSGDVFLTDVHAHIHTYIREMSLSKDKTER